MSHAATDSPVALEALARVGALYKIEAEIRGKSPDERRAARQARALPQLTALHAWLHTTVRQASRKSAIANAIGYTLSHWQALTRYCQDGRIEIDNNAAERALRTVALGRKNYLFAGSDAGGDRAAAFYSLSGTAKLNGLDPEAYLREVFARIAEHPINRIESKISYPGTSPATRPTRSSRQLRASTSRCLEQTLTFSHQSPLVEPRSCFHGADVAAACGTGSCHRMRRNAGVDRCR